MSTLKVSSYSLLLLYSALWVSDGYAMEPLNEKGASPQGRSVVTKSREVQVQVAHTQPPITPSGKDFIETPPLQKLILSYNKDDLSQLEDVYPGVLLQRLTSELEKADKRVLSEEFLTDTFLKGVFSIHLCYHFSGELPQGSTSFLKTLRGKSVLENDRERPFGRLKLNRKQRKDLEELYSKGTKADLIHDSILLKTFFPDSDPRLKVMRGLIETVTSKFDSTVRNNFKLSPNVLLFAPSKSLIGDEKFLTLATRFGVPRAIELCLKKVNEYHSQRNITQAMFWARKAAETNELMAMCNLGVLLKGQGKHEEAEGWFRKTAEAGLPEGMCDLGVLLEEQGKYEEAEDWQRRAADANYPEGMHNLGGMLLSQGKIKEAECWFRKAATTGLPEGLCGLGVALEKQGKINEAEPWFRKAAKAGLLEGMSNLGVVLEKLGRSEEAEGWFRKAAEAGFPRAMYKLGVRLKKQGKIKEAEGWFRKAATGFPEGMCDLGVLLAEQGDSEKAEFWYRKAADANIPQGMHNLGCMLVNQGKIQEAEQWYRKAAEAGLLTAIHNLGGVLEKQGKINEAEQWYRKAAEAGSLEGMCGLGVALEKQERSEEAEQWWKKAAKAGHSDAIHNLGSLSQMRGEKEEAMKWLREAISKGSDFSLIPLAELLPLSKKDEKERLYKQALERGVRDAEVFYIKFLVDLGHSEEAEDYQEFFESDSKDGSDEDDSSDSNSVKNNNSSLESSPPTLPTIQQEKPSVPSAVTPASSSIFNTQSTINASKEKDVPLISKRLQKRYDRAQSEIMKPISTTSGQKELPKTYTDVRVLADPEATAEIRDQEIKIKFLISCLANGEPRGKFEKLSGHENGFSMRLTKGDRFVFEILEGDMVKGVRALKILSAKGHYNSLDTRISKTTEAPKHIWSDESDKSN